MYLVQTSMFFTQECLLWHRTRSVEKYLFLQLASCCSCVFMTVTLEKYSQEETGRLVLVMVRTLSRLG